MLEAPLFLIGAPGAGTELLANALRRGAGVVHPVGWRMPPIDPGDVRSVTHGRHDRIARGDRLDRGDVDALGAATRASLLASLRDRAGAPPDVDRGPWRVLASGGPLGLQVPFLDAVSPDCRFVLVVRELEPSIGELVRAWRSGRWVSAPELPNWVGPPWSLPLIPEWRSLSGRSLEEIAVEQWRTIAEFALDDLAELTPERWALGDLDTMIADPPGELRRLCGFLGIPYDQAMLSPLEDARRNPPPPSPAFPRGLLAPARPVHERADALRATPVPAVDRALLKPPSAPLASGSTPSFAERLDALASSLLISTYQSGSVIVAREREGRLNTHFRSYDRPMGMAVQADRLAIGTRTEVWDLRNQPALAASIEPAGHHDACYVPRTIHFTGDVAIHDLAFAGGELWLVATAFSCLATLHPDYSFVPRWKPDFVTEIATGDRCHLNGLCVVEDHVRYVTALGRFDHPRGWKATKATGGMILEVPASEVVAHSLSMPHSPRWHDGQLWVLQSGKGELCHVDITTGHTTTVAQLPGFTRGLAFAGHTAFVGLSQIRESSTFGDLPLIDRLDERACGVWMIDTRTGQIEGVLKFADLVQEIFDVAIVAHRYPEIAQAGSPASALAFSLP